MDTTLSKTLQSIARVKDLTPQTEKFIAHLASLHAANVADIKTSVHHGEESKHVDVSFSQELVAKWGRLEIIELADVQWGTGIAK